MKRGLRIARSQTIARRAIRPTQTELKLLTDVADLLLSNGITPSQVHALMDSAFAHAAARTAQLKNGRTNYSRVAAKTGLRRAVVRDLLRAEVATPDISSPLDRLACGWRSDGDFLDGTGKPKELVIGGRRDPFTRLARRYAPDIPTRALIDELIGSGLASLRGRALVLRRSGNAQSRRASKTFHVSVRAFLACWYQSSHVKRRQT